MISRIEWWIFALLVYTANGKIVSTPKEENETRSEEKPSEAKTPVGRLCMTVEHFRSLPNDTSGFFECSTLAEEERKEYGIDGKYLGLWTKRSCPKDHAFDVAKQRCLEKKKLHRQQAACLANPGSVGCQYVCAAPIIEDPRIGIPCTWQQSRLYNDPSNNSGFLQCIATSTSDPCGEWSRVECPAATTFELTIQICAPLFIQQKPVADVLGACSASNEVAVCRCGAISQGCPGISTCRSGVCCAAVDPILVVPNPALQPMAQAPICAGSGSYPVSSCSVPCPPQYNCQPAVGCCPVILMPATSAPATTTAASKMILVQLTTCPGSSTPPIGSCGSCPSGYSCAPLLGACCPAPAPPPPPPPTTAAPAPQPVILLCPKTNTPPVGNCGSCPPNYVCAPMLGACCPAPAPTTTAAPPPPPPPPTQYVLLCPGTNTPPQGPCNPCPPQMVCTPIGCCPPPAPPPPPPTTTAAPAPPQIQFVLCPGTNTKPTPSCNVCPPTYMCIPSVGGCCPAPAPPPTTTAAPPPPPQYVLVCPNTNTKPTPSCNVCPPPMVCTPIGCCPAPAPPPTTTAAPPPPPPIQIVLCPNTNTPPVASCGSCPPSYVCQPMLGACCPAPAPPPPPPTTTSIPATLYLVCQSGTPASQPCTTTPSCPTGNVCYQGGCCPCQCPPQAVPVTYCPQMTPPAAAAPSCVCINGCCCQEQPSLPTCSNGQLAVIACTAPQQCSTGQECSNGGCCPIPFCPSGVQAAGHCASNGGTACQVGMICLEGLCCPLPQCTNGQPAASFCTTSAACNPGSECQNGGCCNIPIPLCPSGAIALAPCPPSCSGSTAVECCPSGYQCVNGGCCALPTCPTSNQLAILLCSPQQPQCPSGNECNTAISACCPLPLCPSGSQALQRCGSGCPAQTSCVGGLCCPLPVCASTGQVASSLCGPSSSCPSGQYCNGVACCVLPVCPSGGTAIQSCVQGTECPSGYGCSSGGGCCPLVNVADVVCPIASYPICQCSSTSLCPTGSSCYPSATPTCCAASPTVLMAVPGVPCEASPQCSGYSNGASCYQNLCVCLKGSFSNGASCVYQDPIVIEMAHSGCDQFGTPCRFVLSAARRRPLLSSNKNTTAEPLWFNVSGERRCPRDLPEADNTCLPSETCVDGVCKTRLWPGEYGCSSDAECTSRCPNTYCEQKSDKNLPQCQCKSGMLLYGRCFDVCPRGFHESGAYCQHDNEDAFWADPAAQQEIQTLLNNGVC